MASKEDEKQCSDESLNSNSDELNNVEIKNISDISDISDESPQLNKGTKRRLSGGEAREPTADEFIVSPPSLNNDSLNALIAKFHCESNGDTNDTGETSEKSERLKRDSSESNEDKPPLFMYHIDIETSKQHELKFDKLDGESENSDESTTASNGALIDLSKYRMDEAIYIHSTSGADKKIGKDLIEYEVVSPNPSVNSEEYEKLSYKCGKCSPNASFESQEKLNSHDEEVHGIDSSIVKL